MRSARVIPAAIAALTVVILFPLSSSSTPAVTPGPTTSSTTSTTQPPAQAYHGHPVNRDGYVTDGSAQRDDEHCSTPPGSGGPEPGQDQCLAARHDGYVTDGDPQLSDDRCEGSPYQQAQCVTARRFSPNWQAAFECVAGIVNHEDPAWDPTVYNRGGSGAYGLPQSLPGSKMASAGAEWRTSAVVQVRWLIDWYAPRYGGVCGAWDHEQRYGTY